MSIYFSTQLATLGWDSYFDEKFKAFVSDGGTPARVIRTLGEAEAQMIARAADGYVKRWQRYTAGLKRIG